VSGTLGYETAGVRDGPVAVAKKTIPAKNLSSIMQQVARSSAVVEALCYMPEGRGFETRSGEWNFSIYLFLPAALGLGVHSASNRNEYQKQKNNVSREQSAAGA
jgi:hypothetical protein